MATKAEAHLIKFADLLCTVMAQILTIGPMLPAFSLKWPDFRIEMLSAIC